MKYMLAMLCSKPAATTEPGVVPGRVPLRSHDTVRLDDPVTVINTMVTEVKNAQ